MSCLSFARIQVTDLRLEHRQRLRRNATPVRDAPAPLAAASRAIHVSAFDRFDETLCLVEKCIRSHSPGSRSRPPVRAFFDASRPSPAALADQPGRFTAHSCFVHGPANTSMCWRSPRCCSPCPGVRRRAAHPVAIGDRIVPPAMTYTLETNTSTAPRFGCLFFVLPRSYSPCC
jgi:hypothetical protein